MTRNEQRFGRLRTSFSRNEHWRIRILADFDQKFACHGLKVENFDENIEKNFDENFEPKVFRSGETLPPAAGGKPPDPLYFTGKDINLP